MNIETYYRKPDRNNILLGRMIEYAMKSGQYKTYAALSEANNIHPSAVHNLISLLTLPAWIQDMVESGQVKFKIARAFTQVVGRDDFAEKIKPFTDGTMNSVHCERYVKLMEKYPDWTAMQLIRACTLGEYVVKQEIAAAQAATATAPEVVRRPEPVRVRPAEVLEAAARLYGLLMNIEWDDSIDSLRAKSLLKRLGVTVEERKVVLV